MSHSACLRLKDNLDKNSSRSQQANEQYMFYQDVKEIMSDHLNCLFVKVHIFHCLMFLHESHFLGSCQAPMVEGAVEELRELRKLRYERQEKRALMNYEGITHQTQTNLARCC